MGIVVFTTLEQTRLRIVAHNTKQTRTETLDQIITLTGESLEALASDYTFWDDMVKFVEKGNPAFAKENLDTSLGTYKVDRLSVYRLDGTAVHQIMRGANGEASPAGGSLLPVAMVKTALAGERRFCHFFIDSEQGPIEIRGATIHSSSDQQRLKPPHGYFFVGRVWNQAWLSRLASLSRSVVAIERPRGAGEFSPLPGDTVDELHFAKPFLGLDGQPAFRLHLTSSLTSTRELSELGTNQLILQIVLSVTLLVVTSVLVSFWVTSPLNTVSRALDEHRPGQLERMLARKDEFGRLAQLVSRYFDQEEKLLEAMKAKSDFTSMVSHELRTPLSVITECISLLHEGIAGPVNAEQRDFLETARRNVDRLHRLVNDVLDYQKLEAQRMEFHFVESDINELVTQSARGFELVARAKGLAMVSRLDARLPSLRLDRDKIAQVLNNFFDNAIKFTERGTITIETAQTADGVVTVAVTDEGIGIKEEDIPKLFRSFSQISSGVGRKAGGTGLGLAISKDIIEKHHGRVGVESVPGRGSTFYFTLPAKGGNAHDIAKEDLDRR